MMTQGGRVGSGEITGQQGDPPALANKLMTMGYLELFQGSGEEYIDTLWKVPGVPEILETLTVDPEAPALARFIAAEVLFYQRGAYPLEEQRKQLASVYALALGQNFTGAANTWGLPEILDGLAGVHFVALGEDAIPELKNLLADDKRVYYEGSEEATLGNGYCYRVKDLAAYYISKIRSIPIDLGEDPSRRDKEIQRLKSIIK